MKKVYYDSIGVDDNDSRNTPQVQARAALTMALLDIEIPDGLISTLVHRDRTSLFHYRKKHDMNLKGWPGYSFLFEKARWHSLELSQNRSMEEQFSYVLGQEALIAKKKKDILAKMVAMKAQKNREEQQQENLKTS